MKKIVILTAALALASTSFAQAPSPSPTPVAPAGYVDGRVVWQPDPYNTNPVDEANVYLSRVDPDSGVRVWEGWVQTDYNGDFLLRQPRPFVSLRNYDYLVVMRSGFPDVYVPIALDNGYNQLSDVVLEILPVYIWTSARLEGNRLIWTGYVTSNKYLTMPEKWVVNTTLGGTTFKSQSAQTTLGSLHQIGTGYQEVYFEKTIEIPAGPSGTWIWGTVSVTRPNTVLNEIASPAFFAVLREDPLGPVFFSNARAFEAFQEAVRRGENPTRPAPCVILPNGARLISKPAPPTNPGFSKDPDEFDRLMEPFRARVTGQRWYH